MALQSMTGFARSQADISLASIVWEIRSVNGRSLDVRLRTPQGYDWIDADARKAIQQTFARGNIQASLTVTQHAMAANPVVNEDFLKDVAGLAKRLEKQFGCKPASADGLLALKGVLELPETVIGDVEKDMLGTAILGALDEALAGLTMAREAEGAALVAILSEKLAELEILSARAEADPSRSAEAIRQRLSAQVQLLLDGSSQLDETRLSQEAAFLATKADIREELDRLNTHISASRELLSGDRAVGRKLDFIAQEFNRESNTLCSKSNATSITAVGLEMKVVIDQFREQVQNLE